MSDSKPPPRPQFTGKDRKPIKGKKPEIMPRTPPAPFTEAERKQIAHMIREEETKTNKSKKITYRITEGVYNELERIAKKEHATLSQLLGEVSMQFIEVYQYGEMQAREEARQRAEALKAEFESFPKEVQETILAREAKAPEEERFYERAMNICSEMKVRREATE